MTAVELNAMYARNPRAAWTPLMAHFFHRQPESMWDLTPAELDSLVESTAASASGGGS